MAETEDFSEDLKRNGLKSTKRRAAILSALEQSDAPMTAEEVFLKLGGGDSSASLSTVYRAIERLTEKGLLTRLTVEGDAKALYEYNRMVHRHYLICLGCRKMRPISGCPLGDYEESVERETNFVISGHKLDLYGYCPDCMKRGAGKTHS
jgi:Fur family ferric uptake transcriptional regulator